jgi:acyl phosphate:glycerol-3-phosphate acyltransferase
VDDALSFANPGGAVAVLAGAYLLGSIPFGLWLVRWVHGVDVRTRGSGNIGATNVARAVGKIWGVLVLVLDAAKGALPVAAVSWAGGAPALAASAGGAAVFGHVFSIFLKGRGGKGVATGAGAFTVLSPAAIGIALAGFGAAAGLARSVGIGSMVGALALAVATVALREPWYVQAAAVGVAAVVEVRHRGNFVRFLGRKPRAEP